MTITVSCPSCDTSFPVDPDKIPPEGVRAQCSVCPEIFDIDPQGVATLEAPPLPEPTADVLEAADPLEAGAVDLPPLEGSFEGAESATTESEPDVGDVSIDSGPGEATEPVEAVEATAETDDAESPGPIRFGRRSPEDKAKSLARSLVSDLIAYNPEKHKEALSAGTLQEVFGEEIEKSLKEYQEQVEADVMAQGTFFNDALNSILAEGQSVFAVDG